MSDNDARVNRSPPSLYEKTVTLDDVLVNEAGEIGIFQLKNVFLVAIPIILSAFRTDYIFTAAAIPHRCQIPECGEDITAQKLDQEWILNAVPEASSAFSSCQRYAPLELGINGSLDYCPANLFNQSQINRCDSYIYARNNTIVYDFDLGCQEWLRTLAGTISGVGYFIGVPISGYLSDKFGRKFALVFSIFNMGFIGLLKAFSVNYTMYMILQLLQTCVGAGSYAAANILATELVGPKYRVKISALTGLMFSVGQVTLGGVAWIVQYWRYLTVVIYIPLILCISYFWILTESVRWLLSRRKYVRAKKVLETLVKTNKTTISEKSLESLINPPQTVANNEIGKPGLIRHVINSPVLLRRVCTTPVWWITATVTYYGLSINSTSLSGIMYLNYILTCAIEIPGFFLATFLLERIGRKTCLSSCYFFTAICNIIFVFLPSNYNSLRLILYLLGKLTITMVMMSLYLYTLELYPTEFRNSLLGFSSMIGRIGATVAPLTPALAIYWHGIPYMIFGVLGIISGLLVLTQPDTMGTKMPDTLAQAEALGSPESKSTYSS